MTNFGGLLPEFTDPEKALFFVLPVPYDLTSTYQSGSRKGPGAILDASANMELFDEELKRETYLEGIHTLEPLEADARGPGEMVERVREKIAEILGQEKIPVVLGGEHSISFGAVKAMKRKYPGISVLQMDAHADLRDSYQGTPFSHAAVARRILEECPLVQAGIRSMSVEEGEFLKKSGVNSFSADYIRENSGWPEEICRGLSDDVYLTLDLDVFDPAFMPATGTPEPGGWSWHDVLRLVREVSRRRRIRGFDVVELSPIPGLVAPDFLAAKLVYRIMGYIATR
ncbi:MAG: agmatinase [Syntrophales bacterium]|nr:agmatinase [Syntrophales bacterium]MDD5232729.1 agmatinase [Syntrophales bacterium]MDD5531579.1 agmatinase [Syntrophales bacterium]